MKLSKSEIRKVAELYGLGDVKKSVELNRGWVNFSYDVCTDSGEYIIQILGSAYDARKQDKMKMEFAVLNHLKGKKFPYEIPVPIFNRNQEYMSDLGKGRHLWTYRKIEGDTVSPFNRKQFGEAIKGLAMFHKYIRDFKWPGKPTPINFDWTSEGYKQIRGITPKNSTDRLVLKNLPLLESYIERLEKIDFDTRMQIIHTDFNNENILFRGDKLVGIIDFNDVEFAPVAKDVALAIKRVTYPQWPIDKPKMKLCLAEYRKHATFTKKEEKLIIPLLIGENCMLIRWFYWNMKKHLDERYTATAETIEQTKQLASWIGW